MQKKIMKFNLARENSICNLLNSFMSENDI